MFARGLQCLQKGSVPFVSNGGQWNPLGAFNMAPGQNHRIELNDEANGYLIADAVQVTRVGAPPPIATWTPTLPARDRYQVYARWRALSSHATDAPYIIYHEGGNTTVRVDQQASNATWVLLGTFTMAPGQGHRVELRDDANGQVAADAVKFVPEPVAKVARWDISVTTTGSYKVYANWPASSAHATDAPYTVTHSGGTTLVTANQRANGGSWNFLGTFTFNTGTAYKVDLSDQVANAKVAADAIYVVRDVPPTDAFTWTPTFPSAGTYNVFARWPASSGNTAAATYTVTRAGGTSTVVANQKQNGGAWVPLGSYSFTPGAGHKVTLTGSADGTTIADAMLFVASGSQPGNLLYVHADHLGSPQKLTDPAQATVWDGVFDPFGEEVSIGGLAAMPMRFPGQYADDETGYSYNYFRDYEPTLGRYVQSDPIGLNAGPNTYSYVRQAPIRAIDPFGLFTCNADGTVNPTAPARNIADGAAAWAQYQYEQGSLDYTLLAPTCGGSGAWKCNCFVQHALNRGGGMSYRDMPKMYDANGKKTKTPFRANDIGDTTKNTDILGIGSGAVGDLVASPNPGATGHMGIVGCDGRIYSARQNELDRQRQFWFEFWYRMDGRDANYRECLTCQ